MKILLLQPPVEDFYDTDVRLQPIGACYLKAVIKQHFPNFDVVVKDYHNNHGRKTIAIPHELKYLTPYYGIKDTSPFGTFHQYFHYGADYQDIADDVEKFVPDLVGISALFSSYYREVVQVARAIKARMPHVPILIGGGHVSAVKDQVLQESCIDYLIYGEGERPMIEFLQFMQGRRSIADVANLGYRSANDGIILNAQKENFEIDDIPNPDLSDFSCHSYRLGKRNLTFMITSRSCPHRCSFCSVHQTFGFNYRRRSVDSIMAEIIQRHHEGYRVIDFEDDNLTFFKPAMKELCHKLIQHFPPGEMQFVAMNGISYLSLDDELLLLMRQAGFTHLNLALVSSDKTVRESTKRPHTTAKYLEVVGRAHQMGFKIVSYQILGLPSETIDSMIQTLCFNSQLPILLGASPFYLIPNSPIAKDFPKQDEVDYFKARLSALAIETPLIKREQVFTLFVTTRIINYIKGISLKGETRYLSQLLSCQDYPTLQTLQKLLSQGILEIKNSKGNFSHPKFCFKTFSLVWQKLDKIVTLDGGIVICDVEMESVLFDHLA